MNPSMMTIGFRPLPAAVLKAGRGRSANRATDVDHPAAAVERPRTERGAPAQIRGLLQSPNGETVCEVESNLTIGRASDNALKVECARVSRYHATIQVQGDRHVIIDLDSRNGTIVNGKPIEGPTLLDDRDTLEIGLHSFVYRRTETDIAPRPTDRVERTVHNVQSMPVWMVILDIEGYSRLCETTSAEVVNQLVTAWTQRCQDIVQGLGGVMNKQLGDGLFATWRDSEIQRTKLVQALFNLAHLQLQPPRFRLVVHYGEATFSGSNKREIVTGREVNFAFRMEKLAKKFQSYRLFSEPAYERLRAQVSLSYVGASPVDGFDGDFEFFSA